jgi:GNAT superfamily N-acetyltransferase
MHLRPARADDRSALIALQRRASLAWEEDRAALLAHPEVVDLPLEQILEGQVTVAESGGAAVGFSVVLPEPDGTAELDGLFVEPHAWGRGIGRRLVEAAASAGPWSLTVVANLRAEGFYRACGFEAVGRAPTRFGPAVRMRKPSSP